IAMAPSTPAMTIFRTVNPFSMLSPPSFAFLLDSPVGRTPVAADRNPIPRALYPQKTGQPDLFLTTE
ncbi:hypothetical protein, partial [Lactiplantibacillus plantarum]|uniref:hypothetical protein n=1 Tax=Lactiplantibacillus plantarum TaxID=1590 RepID=UPI003C13F9A6